MVYSVSLSSIVKFTSGAVIGGSIVFFAMHSSIVSNASSQIPQAAQIQPQPSKAIRAEDLLIQKANALQVIEMRDHFRIREVDQDSERFTYYYPSEMRVSSVHQVGDSPSTSSDLYGVTPDCQELEIHAEQYITLIAGVDPQPNYSRPITPHEYRLLCTDY
ncbi:hypothetical protein C7B61_00260 [filamentous cyanobacterium CCP1]|nr:hypothetical protein C7B76_16800 [filamentous cyanobacterium CCP2]PSB68532.1 hypothetical protein C7B61_00260 [filamentous cyanobacterium CCP1]